jgi:hypothetical protein
VNVGPAFARTVRHFFPDFNAWLDEVADPRCQERITYSRRFLLWYGIVLFVGKRGSRRQLDCKYREAGTCVLDNLNRLAQADQQTIPCNDTLDDYLAKVRSGPLADVRTHTIHRLVRLRVLDQTRVQGRLVVGVAGSGYLVFGWQHCPHCLTPKCGDPILYGHRVLEAKVLGPAQTVLSLGAEFIDNQDVTDSLSPTGEQRRQQDCALKAARRLLQGVRAAFPQLHLCLSLDALYACGAGFQLGKDFRVSLVIVFKEGSIPTLWQEFQTLLPLCPANRLEVREDGWRHA